MKNVDNAMCGTYRGRREPFCCSTSFYFRLFLHLSSSMTTSPNLEQSLTSVFCGTSGSICCVVYASIARRPSCSSVIAAGPVTHARCQKHSVLEVTETWLGQSTLFFCFQGYADRTYQRDPQPSPNSSSPTFEDQSGRDLGRFTSLTSGAHEILHRCFHWSFEKGEDALPHADW